MRPMVVFSTLTYNSTTRNKRRGRGLNSDVWVRDCFAGTYLCILNENIKLVLVPYNSSCCEFMTCCVVAG